MKFGFITYERAKDAYTVIDSSSNDSTINMYDISFGGRRQFCGASYMDLGKCMINKLFLICKCDTCCALHHIDGNGDEQTSFAMIPSTATKLPQLHEDSFEEMLKAVKERICPNAASSSSSVSSTATTIIS